MPLSVSFKRSFTVRQSTNISKNAHNKEAIREYVKGGDTVMVSFMTGVYDEYCQDFDPSFMEELFGIKG